MTPFAGDRRIDPDKVAVYIRWSTDEQGQGTTLEVQKEACEHYCRSQGWRFREDLVYVDDGYSAADLNRPALTKLREAAQAGLVESVVVYKLDRLSRNLLDCVWLVRQEWGNKCALYSTRENFDTNSPVGQMVFNILVSFAEFERNIIRERTLSGKRKRAEQGRNAGQRYPYGYRKGADGGWELEGWDADNHCLTGPAAVARRIFTEFLAGAGTVTVARGLNEEGIPAPMGGQWRFGAVIRTLDNPIYAGRYEYGKLRSEGNRPAGAPAYTVAGAVPAIITEAEFAAVQRLRRERAARPPRSLHSKFLLSGIARCTECSGVFTGYAGKGKGYYVCRNRSMKQSCDCAWIDAKTAERTLLSEVKAAIAGPDIRREVERLQPEIRQRVAARAHAVALAEGAVASMSRKRKRLDEAFFAGNLGSHVYNSRALELEADLVGARGVLDRARAALREDQRATGDLARLAALDRPVDPWHELTWEEQKQALRDLTASLRLFQPRPSHLSRKGNPHPLVVEWQPRLDLSSQ